MGKLWIVETQYLGFAEQNSREIWIFKDKLKHSTNIKCGIGVNMP